MCKRGIIACKDTSHSSNVKNHDIAYNLEVTYLWEVNFLCCFYVGWMRGTLIYENPLPPNVTLWRVEILFFHESLISLEKMVLIGKIEIHNMIIHVI